MAAQSYEGRSLHHVSLQLEGPIAEAGDEYNVSVAATFTLASLDNPEASGPGVSIEFGLAVPDNMLAKDVSAFALSSAQALMRRFSQASQDEVRIAHRAWIDSVR
jgi:hypothetical protein